MIMLLTRGICYYSAINQARAWTTTLLKSSTRKNFGTVEATSGYGGDFAGLSGLVDVEKGQVKKVPDHLLPKVFIEWESWLYSLEVLTSEKMSGNGLERIDMEILPEAGCGVDNLEVLTSKSLISTEEFSGSMWEEYNTEYSSILYKDKFKNMILECSFLHLDRQLDHFRSRVILTFDPDYKFLPKKPIKFIYERQTSLKSTHGEIAKGGGLDARTVTNLIGPDIRSDQLFEDPSSFIDADILKGDWKILHQKGSGGHESNPIPESSENTCSVSLPTGIIIRYWQFDNMQYIEISSRIETSKRLFVTYALDQGLVTVDHCVKEKENSL